MNGFRRFDFIATIAVLWATTLHAERSQTRPPNFVVIMADDLGYQDVGFNGCTTIPTPHIDSLAFNGVKFTNGYVAYPVCGPSRAAFITGRYGQRFGFERNPQYRPTDANMGVPPEETTIAEALAPVGYHSGIIGKWHLGAHEKLHPLSCGFDEFFGHLGGGHRYMPEDLTIQDSDQAKDESESYLTWILRNRKPVRTTKYLTDEFSDEAVSFIDRNRQERFFLFLSFNAPHTPLQATAKYLDRFDHIPNPKRRKYAAMVSAVDDGVGKVLQGLRDNGLIEKTLVFFLSDNGGPEADNASNNGPLRAGKGSVYEGGWRVPFAVQWPGQIAPGQVRDEPIISLDIFATMAALASAPIDSVHPLDGIDLMPSLTDPAQSLPARSLFLRKFDTGSWAVRQGDYKMVIPRKGIDPQLFNLNDDLGENNDVTQDQSAQLDNLDESRQTWMKDLVDPRFEGLIHTKAYQARFKKEY